MKICNISITVIMDLIKMLTTCQIQETAEKVGFNKRKKGLKAATFLKTFTFGIWSLHEITLDQLAEKCCEAQYGLTLTKQALSKRLKVGSELLKELLGAALAFACKQSVATNNISILKQLKNVYVCDSTLIDLPDKLENVHQGIGDPNPKASTKLQIMFDVLHKRLKSIELWPARGNDISYNSHIVENLCAGDLVIYDLGYFSMAAFKKIKEKGAFFLSRLKTNTSIYKENKQVDLIEILSNSNGKVDEYVYIGARKEVRTEVRLIAIRLPESVINERRRKAAQTAKRKGRTMKKEYSEFLAWNIMVTNLTENMAETETVPQLYRVRWQIELVFKAWKSHFNIGRFGQTGEDYFNCVLYGKLIMITLMTTLFSVGYHAVYYSTRRTLSMIKFFKGLREKANKLYEGITDLFNGAMLISHILEAVTKRSLADKRKRKTTEQILMEIKYPLDSFTIAGIS